MAHGWNKGNGHWGENREVYRQRNTQWREYGALIKVVIAVAVFTIAYCLHISDTTVGKLADAGVRRMVTTSTDFQYVLQKVSVYLPVHLDMSALKKVQATLSKPADPLLYMIKPVNGKIADSYGWYMDPATKKETMREGIDLAAAAGANVYAAAGGKVKIVSDTPGQGKTLILEHEHNIETVYGHLGETIVKAGEMVSQGQIIGKVAGIEQNKNSGVYFEVRENGKAIDPLSRLQGDTAPAEGK
jgi:murein DD-endopeptidase MepM/ murein hydrolase activator NlpD